jgi:hypothetical protein
MKFKLLIKILTIRKLKKFILFIFYLISINSLRYSPFSSFSNNYINSTFCFLGINWIINLILLILEIPFK